MTFSKEEKTTPILDSSEKTIDLDKRLPNISKLLVPGVFLEPVLDFLGFHFVHSLFNGALIPASRVDLQKKHSFEEKGRHTLPVVCQHVLPPTARSD